MSAPDLATTPQVCGPFVRLRTRDQGVSAGLTVFVAAAHVVAIEDRVQGVVVKTTTAWYPVPYEVTSVRRAVQQALRDVSGVASKGDVVHVDVAAAPGEEDIAAT